MEYLSAKMQIKSDAKCLGGNVSVKSKFQHAPPGKPPAFGFFENYCSNSPYPGENAVQMLHTRVHSGNQMPPPRGHFTGTKMT